MCKNSSIEPLRHTCSHVMAQAVKELWPDVKLAIGPAIENGFYYDFDKREPFSTEDLEKIEQRMQRIINQDLPLRQSVLPKNEAIALFKELKEDYKLELIENLPDEKISIYKTGDGFVDLCKGPHAESTGQIKAFKLLSLAGAYWHGDENNAMLQRIYGTCFASREELAQHLQNLEETQKRDHRKLGTQLDLFNIYHEAAGAGLVFYHPAGAMLRKNIEDYVRAQHMKRGYDFVMTPNILKGKLWEMSGHAGYYRENMYYFSVDQEEYAVKPMNCPGHMLIYKSKMRSYRDLPIRFFELGTVYRQEKAGVLHGLLRVRGFTQDDAHIFCRQDQLQAEVMGVLDFVFSMMKDFGFTEYEIELSTRPEKFIGTVENWECATEVLQNSMKNKNVSFHINEGDGAFYGPKIDIKLKDALGRSWQCATIQCDFALPERFDLTYVNEQGENQRPIMIHRAILGSVERFIGTLIEHYAGAFPLWLAPVQVMIIPIKDSHQAYAQKVKENLQGQGLRVIIDARNESLNKRIREGTLQKIPYLLVVGDREVSSGQVSVRKRQAGDQGNKTIEDLSSQLQREIALKE
ncbi:MAG TPA: threonine--tRNA ligase [Candidatus Omnitrophota bacterium]|nr:threonine--tRNA ligase [Candidatus Omnitrophota bacterium]HPN55279.1 threonine--tRNA ligase [Candidatus Omnitrophota bacterium]